MVGYIVAGAEMRPVSFSPSPPTDAEPPAIVGASAATGARRVRKHPAGGTEGKVWIDP
jgi:hypothetical protein